MKGNTNKEFLKKKIINAFSIKKPKKKELVLLKDHQMVEVKKNIPILIYFDPGKSPKQCMSLWSPLVTPPGN